MHDASLHHAHTDRLVEIAQAVRSIGVPCGLVLNMATLRELRLAKAGDAYLWAPGDGSVRPAARPTILGMRYVISERIPFGYVKVEPIAPCPSCGNRHAEMFRACSACDGDRPAR